MSRLIREDDEGIQSAFGRLSRTLLEPLSQRKLNHRVGQLAAPPTSGGDSTKGNIFYIPQLEMFGKDGSYPGSPKASTNSTLAVISQSASKLGTARHDDQHYEKW